MIRSLLRLILLLVCSAASLQASAPAPRIPSYVIGETARVDVVATVPFVAIDPEATAALRLKEGQRVPTIYRWNTNAVEEALAGVREAFATNRQNFLAALESSFAGRKFDERALTNQRFRRLVGSFQSANKGFPLNSNLARTWALRQPDTAEVQAVEDRVRAALTGYVRFDAQPEEARIGWQVKLVPLGSTNAEISSELLERTRAIARSNVVALGKVRSTLGKTFATNEKTLARFVTSFVGPTCVPDVELTRKLRDQAVGHLSSVVRFAPGDAIVRAGEVVTPVTRAALEEYRARVALLQPTPPPASPMPWILGLTAVLLALVMAGVLWRRSRDRALSLALMPESIGHDAAMAVRDDPVIRARLTEHLTRLLGEAVVQRLLAQRGQLLEIHAAATAETAEMEQRLAKVEANVAERYRAYEGRIAELERELAAAEEERREMIRARILLVQQELEAERAKQRMNWN